MTKVHDSEHELHGLGFTDFRIRLIGECANIQLPENQIKNVIAKRKKILETLQPLLQESAAGLKTPQNGGMSVQRDKLLNLLTDVQGGVTLPGGRCFKAENGTLPGYRLRQCRPSAQPAARHTGGHIRRGQDARANCRHFNRALKERGNDNVLITRVDPEKAEALEISCSAYLTIPFPVSPVHGREAGAEHEVAL